MPPFGFDPEKLPPQERQIHDAWGREPGFVVERDQLIRNVAALVASLRLSGKSDAEARDGVRAAAYAPFAMQAEGPDAVPLACMGLMAVAIADQLLARPARRPRLSRTSRGPASRPPWRSP